MYLLKELKLKFNRFYRRIINNFWSNKQKPITNNKSSNNKFVIKTKINKFGFPTITKEKESNKQESFTNIKE